eukprot:TRINITY_DN4452_c0_g1_i1.p1 TRINITY_DN4452_c0_g1~~TRINITY_DN4452_c0_g1_i1.p1  ORF type:complete len:127 (-),score=40.70 TRINITY_DN4452_c0_g1_i1:88-438(-)
MSDDATESASDHEDFDIDGDDPFSPDSSPPPKKKLTNKQRKEHEKKKEAGSKTGLRLSREDRKIMEIVKIIDSQTTDVKPRKPDPPPKKKTPKEKKAKARGRSWKLSRSSTVRRPM